MRSSENGFLFDINIEGSLEVFHQTNKITHLAFDANISNQSFPGFRIHARQVSRIGITVWIAVFYVEQKNEVITISQYHDIFMLPLFVDLYLERMLASGGSNQ